MSDARTPKAPAAATAAAPAAPATGVFSFHHMARRGAFL